MSDSNTNAASVNERFSSKILEAISSEMAKLQTQEKLRCMFEPLSLYVLRTFQPYALVIVTLLTILVASQIFMLYKLSAFLNRK